MMDTISRYEDSRFYYVWKPHGMPTTFGTQFSFLEKIDQKNPLFMQQLREQWTWQDERGLLNRLDNDTAGLLYFAKNKRIADWYTQEQGAGRTAKIYLCDMLGDLTQYVNTDTHAMRTQEPLTGEKALCVSCPIMHHAHDEQKMVAVRHPDDKRKCRGRIHEVKTYFIPLYYDANTNMTTAYAVINKGIRHQIRVHAASIGSSLIGDGLYKGRADKLLHLRSIGLRI